MVLAESQSRAYRWRILPPTASSDAGRLLVARAIRGFVDGVVSVLLASYLSHLGFSAIQVGAIVTGTLLGSAAFTLAVGLFGYRLKRRQVLLGACVLMAATGLGFAGITDFWPLLVVAVIGTLNPSSGDVSVFLSTEQPLLTETVGARDRTAMFARYSLAGSFGGALGALSSGLPVLIARHQGWDTVDAERSAFVLYALAGISVAFIYATLSRGIERDQPAEKAPPLAESRSIVLRLALLFSLDSFGGGFMVQALLALWLFERFDMSVETAGTVFFVAGLLTATSQLLASPIAARFGLINTMVFTHLPSSIFSILAALMPTAPLAVFFFLLRMSVSSMDVPTRQSYVMAVVPPHERAAAASLTNVPRSLASAISPLIAGALLSQTSFGWPLIIGGGLKIAYDLLLLRQFRSIKPPEEA